MSYNQISDLSLSSNTNLEMIWASGNQLTHLNVSHLSALYDLRIIRNPSLTCVEISSGQDIATVQIENHQSLNPEGCD
ncbi:hypothetical protein [Roseivirga sp.]|uniref:hypothetical protein n=1 Tax=Roseivirga sp. TaxID=1964215 RepID=UPI002B26CE8A|nr:hypothetical protein [Roseivirga sp.]